MKYLYFCIISSFVFLALSCSTPYQPKGLLGGYTDNKLYENCYKVSFWGNQHTNPEDVDKYLMYRCAELAQEKGYDYFAIISEKRDNKRQQNSIRGSRQSTGGNNKSGGSARSNVKWTEYDFNYIIMLCGEVTEIANKTYNAPEILQELAVIIDK